MSEYKISCWKIHDFVCESGEALSAEHILALPDTFSLGMAAQPVELTVSGETPDGRPLEHAVLCNSLSDNGGEFAPGGKILPLATLLFGFGGTNPMVMGYIAGPSDTISQQYLFTAGDLRRGQVFELANVAIHGEQTAHSSFCRGTLIDTPHGSIPIEQLDAGDEVMAMDGSLQLVAGLKRTRFSGLELSLNPSLVPMRIRAGALTGGRPGHDLLVSQDHRLVVDDWRAAYLFGEDEILVPAKSLLNNRSVVVEDHRAGVEYFDLAIHGNGLVCANGLWAETSSEAEISGNETADVRAHAYQSTMAALPHNSDVTFVA